MKFKYNWGWGIAFFFTFFVLTLLAIVFYSRTLNNDLVEEDYYAKELDYQTQIDKINRTQALKEKLEIAKIGSTLQIKYPSTKDLEGEVHIYRPSDKKLDKKVEIIADSSGYQRINLSSFRNGYWKIKINWSLADSLYYNEEDLIIE